MESESLQNSPPPPPKGGFGEFPSILPSLSHYSDTPFFSLNITFKISFRLHSNDQQKCKTKICKNLRLMYTKTSIPTPFTSSNIRVDGTLMRSSCSFLCTNFAIWHLLVGAGGRLHEIECNSKSAVGCYTIQAFSIYVEVLNFEYYNHRLNKK